MEGSTSVSRRKDDSYYGNERPDVVAALPLPLGRVLDVGCGSGGLSRGLRDRGAEAVVGVEADPTAAEQARARLDDVVALPIEQALGRLEPPFQTILCLDLLEHLVDPAKVLRELRSLATDGAHLQISVPNARHFSLVGDLVLHGTFGYTEWGHRDSTHLRWFTRRDLVALVESAGWRVTGTSWPPLGRSAGLHRLTGGRSSEFLVAQIYLSARNPG